MSDADKAVADLTKARLAGEDIASNIRQISKASEELMRTGLTEKALLILLHNMTSLGQRDIKKVLDALPTLAERYLKDE